MFSDISMATIALLYYAAVRVVIPPEYLCCGYPYLANGQTRLAETKSYENRVIFHKMADVMGYMEIESVIVSCGTCYEMLESYELGTVFPEAELMDVSEYIVKNGLYGGAGNACDEKEVLLYHDPCHSPLKHYGYKKTISAAAGRIPELIPFCCGEGGTLALSTPDLSNSLRTRKVRILAPFVEKKHTTLLPPSPPPPPPPPPSPCVPHSRPPPRLVQSAFRAFQRYGAGSPFPSNR
jgi:Fe-S oxidoreductase